MFRRILQSIAASVLGQAGQILIQLISVPLLIQYWGLDYYGEWLLLFTIPSYLSLSDAGLASALSNELLMNISRKEHAKAAQLLGYGMTAIIGFGVIVSVVLALGLHLSDFTTWLKIKYINESDAWLTLLLLMLYVMLALQQELLSAVPRAEGDNAGGRIWITTTRLIEFGVVILMVSQGRKAETVALTYAIVRGMSWLGMFLYYRRHYHWVSQVRIGLFPIASIRHLLGPSLAFFGFAFANSLVLQGSTLLIGAFMTPTYVVIYTTLRTLCNFIRQIINVLTSAIWPELTRALVDHDFSKAILLHRRVCQIAFWSAFLFLIAMEITGGTILSVWTKGTIQPVQPVFTVLLLTALPYSLWNTSATTAISINRHQSIAFAFVMSSLGALAAAIWLIPRYGLAGMAIGLLLGDFFMVVRVFQNSLSILLEERIGKFLPAIIMDFAWLSQLRK
ncbi:lipopolysaccharide biosynthesis protein [Larkinella rosea]|uniref:Lipopolysaccharide biosynthesis protein n=1 Tax=Larkinella rosea TaxID=2025312 RepID=A0A3P1BIE9_9BACT|nr:lipopolysaccharide biosynthesis protein [Larkinella rosea]RRB00877.1 lipopolysaccharide biosynthesis protein [Larkinella rosea]